uniref:Uncharacterized protein n=1 Tax=Arundo donax TaxID=35708 RepID=A0A0A8YT43_ARUDO
MTQPNIRITPTVPAPWISEIRDEQLQKLSWSSAKQALNTR